MTPLSIPVLVSLGFLRWNQLVNFSIVLWNGVTDGLWDSMPLKRNCFLSIAIETLFWCLWSLVFVCLAWPLLDLWTGSHIYQRCHQCLGPIPELFWGCVAAMKCSWWEYNQGVKEHSPWKIAILDHLNAWKSHFQQSKRLLNSETALAISVHNRQLQTILPS